MGIVSRRGRLHRFAAGILLCCLRNNLKTMTLAAAVTRAFGFAGSFKDFCSNDLAIRHLTVIEINPAKNLSPFLQELPNMRFIRFPSSICSG